MMDEAPAYSLSPEALHIVTRDKLQLFGQIAEALSTANYDLMRKFGDDSNAVQARDRFDHWSSLDDLTWAGEALAEARALHDDYFAEDLSHDCYLPFRVGRTFAKSNSESLVVRFDNGNSFASYHDAVGYYNHEFAGEFLCASTSDEETFVAEWTRFLDKEDEARQWNTFFRDHLATFVAELQAEEAGAVRFLGAEKYTAAGKARIVGTVTPRFKPGNCPKCKGKCYVDHTEGRVRTIKCNNESCGHTFKKIA